MSVPKTMAEVEAHNARVARGKGDALIAAILAPATNLFAAQSTDEAKLNKTERAYLALLRTQGHQWIGIQNITLKLADDLRFTPDFTLLTADGRLTMIDTKGGFIREDSFIKIKMAARLFTWIKFFVVQKVKDGWTHKEIKP